MQRTALREAGCQRVYEEKVSGEKRDRRQLARLLDPLREDDVVVVHRLDRLARSTRDLLEIAELLCAAGAGLRSLGEPWAEPPVSPLEAAALVAPTPLLLVHGDRDEYFPVEHFRALVRAAGPAATAWVVPGFGHAENGLTAPLVERIGRWASATISP